MEWEDIVNLTMNVGPGNFLFNSMNIPVSGLILVVQNCHHWYVLRDSYSAQCPQPILSLPPSPSRHVRSPTPAI